MKFFVLFTFFQFVIGIDIENDCIRYPDVARERNSLNIDLPLPFLEFTEIQPSSTDSNEQTNEFLEQNVPDDFNINFGINRRISGVKIRSNSEITPTLFKGLYV